MNTWPGGKRHAMTQDEHERWNAKNYPGTLQLCCACGQPTGRCEEDAIYLEPEFEHQGSLGPLCEACCEERVNGKTPNADITGCRRQSGA